MTTKAPQKPQLSPGLKLAIDLGPLLLFFLANSRPSLFAPLLAPFLPQSILTGEHAGIFVATAVFIPAILIALAVSYAKTRHLPVMPVVTAIIVVVFGGLTLFLQNETFIKLKPTIVYLLFAAVLLGGLAFRKALLGMVFDTMFHLTEEGWKKLTLRWGLFFLCLAVLNEAVWRNVSTDTWVSFKVFGFLPLTFIFAAAQFPLLQRYAIPEEKP
jgi:intracellular septation protein